MEMALTGALYTAARAERFGLVNRVVLPRAERFARRRRFAREIAERSAATIAIGKSAFYAQIEAPLSDAYALASKAMIENLAHPDSAEGIGAFLDTTRAEMGGA